MHTPTQISEPVSVLASLRALLPRRWLQLSEALRLAELQANRLLTLQNMQDEVPVSADIVARLPGIAVDYDIDMPASGATDWDSRHRQWVITLRASEPDTRHRFTLLHEYKHIIDHGHAGLLGTPEPLRRPLPEMVADYFAACVLMPKRLVKTEFFSDTQSVAELANRFDVSQAAMRTRLRQLGLGRPLDPPFDAIPRHGRKPDHQRHLIANGDHR